MCSKFIIGELEYDNVSDLKKDYNLLPGYNGYTIPSRVFDEGCLCIVDPEMFSKIHSLTYYQDGMDYHFTRICDDTLTSS